MGFHLQLQLHLPATNRSRAFSQRCRGDTTCMQPFLQPPPTRDCSLPSRLHPAAAALLPFRFIKLFSTETILIWIDLQFSSAPSCGLAAGAPHLPPPPARSDPTRGTETGPGTAAARDAVGSCPTLPWDLSAAGSRGFPSPPHHPQLCPSPRAAAATCRQCGPAAGHSRAHPALLCALHPRRFPHPLAACVRLCACVCVCGGSQCHVPSPRITA